MVKVFITKYALTYGIYETEGDLIRDDDMFVQRAESPNSFDQYFHGKDFHADKESAILRAEEMRAAKLKSLQKQIDKIQKLNFEVK